MELFREEFLETEEVGPTVARLFVRVEDWSDVEGFGGDLEELSAGVDRLESELIVVLRGVLFTDRVDALGVVSDELSCFGVDSLRFDDCERAEVFERVESASFFGVWIFGGLKSERFGGGVVNLDVENGGLKLGVEADKKAGR